MAPPPDEDEKSKKKKKKGAKLPPLPGGGVRRLPWRPHDGVQAGLLFGYPAQPGGNLREPETVPLPAGARLQGRTPEKHIGSVD